MKEKGMEPFGEALEDSYNGKKNAEIILIRDDGLELNVPIEYFFRSPKDFSNLEKQAIGLCKGKVLDMGAGVGPHSLELQQLGLEVYAIDISSHACEIMKKRGVKNVQCTDFYNLTMDSFDTILLLGRSIGFVGNLKGIKKFLSYCKTRLNPEGIILLDSIDIRLIQEQIYLNFQERNRKLGRYIGEGSFQMKYKNILGDKFQNIQIDPDTLKEITQELGLSCKILCIEEDGMYLARIST
ncbi:MAG: class I SAM-dependent methyltransferase [Candidatus Lokiarchaeota archaeon]|nr:class I SAM-dependent methyltransferase [Candidatus Lokiarchaeota archaeon]